MRTLLAAAAVLVLGGCDYLFSNEPITGPVPEYRPVLLPGVQDADSDEDIAIRVSIHRDSKVGLKGDFVTEKQLTQRLIVFAERRRDMDAPDQPSLVWLEILADREAPWSATHRPLRAAADPDVRIFQVRFRVFDEKTGHPGWLIARVSPYGIRAEPGTPTGEVLRRAHSIRGNTGDPILLSPEEPE